jgi:hypothetical protein
MSLYTDLASRLRSLNLECGLDLEVQLGECSDGHPILVVRRKGKFAGGLVVVHEDSSFLADDCTRLFSMLTPEFILTAMEIGVIDSHIWSYAEVDKEDPNLLMVHCLFMDEPLVWSSLLREFY